MTPTTSSQSLIVAALFGIGVIVAPSLASAGDSAAKIEPADPATLAPYGDDVPMLSSGGNVVTANAWCDPITGVCQTHPWNHHGRSK